MLHHTVLSFEIDASHKHSCPKKEFYLYPTYDVWESSSAKSEISKSHRQPNANLPSLADSGPGRCKGVFRTSRKGRTLVVLVSVCHFIESV